MDPMVAAAEAAVKNVLKRAGIVVVKHAVYLAVGAAAAFVFLRVL